MNCCGQKRLQWQQEITQQEPVFASPEPILENPVAIGYNGVKSCLVKGAETGYIYLFAEQETGLMVDGRDAGSVLKGSQKFFLATSKLSEK